MINKKALSESDICDRYITPAITKAGWAANRWRREYGFTDGKIIVRGKLVARGKRKRADYLLFHTSNLPIALIEAKGLFAIEGVVVPGRWVEGSRGGVVEVFQDGGSLRRPAERPRPCATLPSMLLI